MSRFDWLQTLTGTCAERAIDWLDPAQRPPEPVMDTLTDVHHAGEPWLIPLTVFTLESTPAQLKRDPRRLGRLRIAWRRAWQLQGSPPLDQLQLTGEWAGTTDQVSSIAIGHVLDRALVDNLIPATYSGFVRMLLPGRFLLHLGWKNLHCPAALLQLLTQRAQVTNPAVIDPRHVDLVKLLVHHNSSVWGVHLVCVAAALIGEVRQDGRARWAPNTIVNMIKRSAAVLRSLHAAQELHMGHVDPSGALEKYALGQLPDVQGRHTSTLAVDVHAYLSGVASQVRMQAQHRRPAWLGPWLLPAPRRALVHLPSMRQARAEQAVRRLAQVEVIIPHVAELTALIQQRMNAFEQMHTAFVEARRTARSTGDDCAFDVRLTDGSATLKFCTVSTTRVDRHFRVALPEPDVVLTEFLGAWGPDGEPLTDPFFVSLYRAWVDPAYQARLISAGHISSDLNAHTAGLLRPSGRALEFCQRQVRSAVENGGHVATYVDMDACCAGIVYGGFALLILMFSGLRIHELQQIRVDAENVIGGTDMPPLHLHDGRISVQVFQKSAKNRAPVQHVLPRELTLIWIQARALRTAAWGPEQAVEMEGGPEFGLASAHYLFQAHGQGLRQTDINRMLRAASFGLELPSGQPVYVTAHMERHLYSKRRARRGDDPADIQHALGHTDARMTAMYAETTGGGDWPSTPSGTLWDALAVVPSVQP